MVTPAPCGPCRLHPESPISTPPCPVEARAHRNMVVVALANKLARIAWAVLTKQDRDRTTLRTGVSAERRGDQWLSRHLRRDPRMMATQSTSTSGPENLDNGPAPSRPAKW